MGRLLCTTLMAWALVVAQGQSAAWEQQILNSGIRGMSPSEKGDFATRVVREAMSSMSPDEKRDLAASIFVATTENMDEHQKQNLTKHVLREVMKNMTKEEKMEFARGLMEIVQSEFTTEEIQHLTMPKCPLSDGEGAHFLADKVTLIVVGVCVALLFLLTYLYHLWWTWRQGQLTHQASLLDQVDSYQFALVHKLVPSLSVSKHQFEGFGPCSYPISLQFDELGLDLRDGTCVLSGVTGEFKSGKMAAIMGPSGAGKTTFMNVLCGKATYGTMTGTVLINNQDIDIADVKPLMGFVPQDDVVHEDLTVRENFRFSAKLRNPSHVSSDHKVAIVNDVVAVLQVAHIQQSIVGSVENRGISGGQRKRVNIGIELAACPTLLFLDEPTSGLDSTSSLQIINSLNKMKELGMTIIMVIHQPRYDLFTLFDDVLLLGKGGRTVYQGPSQDAKAYFEGLGYRMQPHDNPADWFMDVIGGEVTNSKNPSFSTSCLFDAWQQQRGNFRAKESASRPWDKADDRAVLVGALNEAWSKVDIDGNDLLQSHELSDVLRRCTGKVPDEAVIDEILARMTRNRDGATRDEFVEYMCRLEANLNLSSPRHKDSVRDLHLATDWDETSEHSELDVPPQPGCLSQFITLVSRNLTKYFRRKEHTRRLVFLICIVAFAFISGAMANMSYGGLSTASNGLTNNILMAHVSLSMVLIVTVLPAFQDRPIFWRESSSGLSTVAYFFANMMFKWLDVFLFIVAFISIFYLFTHPVGVTSFEYIEPALLLGFAASGWGCCLSAWLPPASATLGGVILGLVLNLLLGLVSFLGEFFSNDVLTFIVSALSATRWSVPMTLLSHLEWARQKGVCVDMVTEASEQEYRKREEFAGLGFWYSGVVALLLQGLVMHLLGLIGLLVLNRSKRV